MVSRLAVVGSGPLAHCLLESSALGWQVGTQPESAPVLWRYADPSTGESLRDALDQAECLIILCPEHSDGLRLYLHQHHNDRPIVWVGESPAALPGQATRLELASVWTTTSAPLANFVGALRTDISVVWDATPRYLVSPQTATSAITQALEQPGSQLWCPWEVIAPEDIVSQLATRSPKRRPKWWPRCIPLPGTHEPQKLGAQLQATGPTVLEALRTGASAAASLGQD